MQVLVDGGSIHNFIHERLAKFLGLPSHLSEPFSELVANSDVSSTVKKQSISLNLQLLFYSP